MDIAHAQLPISQYVKLNCREVLAINHGELRIYVLVFVVDDPLPKD